MPRRAAARALVALALAAAPAVSADGMIKNAEAYWVIDPTDQTCLTELGTFGACDDDALYMYLSRPVGFLDPITKGHEVPAKPRDGPGARPAAGLPLHQESARPDRFRWRRLLLRKPGPAVGDAPVQREAGPV